MEYKSMNISCPGCALAFPLEAGTNDANARRFAKLMGDVPPVMANELLQYLSLFKPKKQGLRWARAVKLLSEIIEDIKQEKIMHNGRAWIAPAPLWKEAIEIMQSRQHELDLPMGNHNYLYKIIAGLSDKIEAQQEQRTEKQRQSGQHREHQEKDELTRLLEDKAHFENQLKLKPGHKTTQDILDTINERIEQHRS